MLIFSINIAFPFLIKIIHLKYARLTVANEFRASRASQGESDKLSHVIQSSLIGRDHQSSREP